MESYHFFFVGLLVFLFNKGNQAQVTLTSKTASIPENSPEDATVVTLAASGGTPTYTYSLTGASSEFIIKNDMLKVKTGAVLDYETTKSYTLQITVTDSTATTPLSAKDNLTVTITDVNEAPAFNKATYVACVNKTTKADVTIIVITASDPDVGDVITYEIEGGSDYFKIASTTGQITVNPGKTIPDNFTSSTLTVKAIDDDTPHLTGTATVNVTVGNSCRKNPDGSKDPSAKNQGNFAEMVACNNYAFLYGVVLAIMFSFFI